MSFIAKTFIFDGIPSENYGIVISSTGGSEISNSSIADIDITTTKIYKRPKTFLYGVSQSPALQFSIEFNSISGELTATDLSLISEWLFGQQSYKKLQIIQDDMVDLYFNCFLVKPEVIKYGNMIGGVKATVLCDSPFAYTFPRTSNYDYASPPVSSLITFDNFSHDSFYLYPTLEFTMTSSANGDLEIINITDDNRTFTFTDLAANEVIAVNNDLQVITSSLSLLRLSKFNKNFFRFLKGRNILYVTGDITNLKFTYEFSRKVG